MFRSPKGQAFSKQINDFLDSPEIETSLLLSNQEIKKIANLYPSLMILAGSCAEADGNKKLCHLVK